MPLCLPSSPLLERTYTTASSHPHPLLSHPQAINTTLSIFLQRAEEEDSKEVVKTICDSVVDMAQEMGPVAIHVHIDAITKLLLKLVQQQVPPPPPPPPEYKDACAHIHLRAM